MSRPYIVALTFGTGDRNALVSTAVLAPTPEFAAAMVVEQIVREGVEGQISGVSVMEMTRQFIENALRALDDRLPKSGKADIVSLVQSPSKFWRRGPSPNPMPYPYQGVTCEHKITPGYDCDYCPGGVADMPGFSVPADEPA